MAADKVNSTIVFWEPKLKKEQAGQEELDFWSDEEDTLLTKMHEEMGVFQLGKAAVKTVATCYETN